MILENKKIQNILSSFLIIAILTPSIAVFFIPGRAEAQVSVDPAAIAPNAISNTLNGANTASSLTRTLLAVKDAALKILTVTLRIIAKKALAQLTQSTVNWINTGKFGNPLFIENPSEFFNDITKSEIKNLVAATGYDELRYPFAKQYLIGVIRGYKRTQQRNAQYSLSRAIGNPTTLRGYRENFNMGGWAAFLVNTQIPQNNPLGYMIQADDELANQVVETKTGVDKLLQQGAGFLSPKVCPSNPLYPATTDPLKKPGFVFTPPAGLTMPDENDPKYDPDDYFNPLGPFQQDMEAYNAQHNSARFSQEDAYNKKYACPKGFKNTTPGAVSANLVMDALGATQKTKEAAAAWGLTDSLAAIFDATFNKLLDKGLNELVRVSNRKPPDPDTFNYYGETLGSPTDDVQSGPDNPIVLRDFKKIISGKTVIFENQIIVGEEIGNKSGQTVTDATAGITYVFNTTGGVSINRGGITTSGTYEYIPGAKEATITELALIDNPPNVNDPTDPKNANPGILQVLNGSKISDGLWQTAKALDRCLPGPDKGWEQRLAKEEEKAMSDITGTAGTVVDSTEVIRSLKFAVGSLKDWMLTAMINSPPLVDVVQMPVTSIYESTENYAPFISISNEKIPPLPNAIIYIDAIQSIDENFQQLTDLTNKRRAKTLAIARMATIEAMLAPITVQPAPGSVEEKNLIAIWKQYDAFRADISSSASIEDTRNELGLLKEKKSGLLALNNECQEARINAGWTLGHFGVIKFQFARQGQGAHWKTLEEAEDVSAFTKADGTLVKEKDLFCAYPVVGGYSHGGATAYETPEENPDARYIFNALTPWFYGIGISAPSTDPTGVYKELPMVNAYGVLNFDTKVKRFLFSEIENRHVSVQINCNTVYYANDLDYIRAGDVAF